MTKPPDVHITVDPVTGDDLLDLLSGSTPASGLSLVEARTTHVSSGTTSQLIAAGKDVAIVLAPVLAFYLGKGRTITVRRGADEAKLSGYSAQDAIELLRVLQGEAQPPDGPPEIEAEADSGSDSGTEAGDGADH